MRRRGGEEEEEGEEEEGEEEEAKEKGRCRRELRSSTQVRVKIVHESTLYCRSVAWRPETTE
jgi:hypothetical protein